MKTQFSHQMIKSTSLLFWLFFSILISSCSLFDEDVDPQKNPRDYVWVADTLLYPGSFQTALDRIWGSSSNDVYVVGHCNDVNGTMYHFNGKQWNSVVLATSLGGNVSGFHRIYDVHGFREDDVWAVGFQAHERKDTSLVIHFDGLEWNEVDIPTGPTLYSVWGSSPDDIWAGGKDGYLIHFDGSRWQADSLPVTYEPDAVSYVKTLAGDGISSVYALFVSNTGQYYRQNILRLTPSGWENVYLPGSVHKIWVSTQNNLYAQYYEMDPVNIHRFNGDSWPVIWETKPDSIRAMPAIGGTDDSNIFVGTRTYETYVGGIYHFNGIDWFKYEVPKIQPCYISDIWADGSAAFVVGNCYINQNKVTIIYRGG